MRVRIGEGRQGNFKASEQLEVRVQSSTRTVFRKGLLWAMSLGLAAYVAGVVLNSWVWKTAGNGWTDEVVNGWLGLMSSWMPVTVCAVALWQLRFRRWEVILATAALAANAAGDTYYVWEQATTGSISFPSVADAMYLLFYPLLLAALVVAVRRHMRGLATLVWLDCAVGSLGATSVLCILLRPVLSSAAEGPASLGTIFAIAYPMFDLVLVAAVAAVVALQGVRLGERWGALIVGLVAFAVADVVFGLQVSSGSYVVGTPLDAVWSIGLVLIAVWVDASAQSNVRPESPPEARPATHGTALVVSSLATASALGVLFVGTQVPLSLLAVTLAGVTLLAAGARAQLSFRLLSRMADLRRLAATTDELTGLPNRRALYAEGYERLIGAPHRPLALLMLDLDKFKEVNDSLGHHAGDQLLVQVGARLREQLRGDDMLARLGGDEFAIMVEDAGYDEALDVAVKLRAALEPPFALKDIALEGIALHSAVSIGIALFPDDGPDLSTLLRKADIAMYRAKTLFEGHHVYCTSDNADNANRLQTVAELRTALTQDQLLLHYQPKIDLNTGEVHSVEALVRWDHPTRGLLYPDSFLALVEEFGLMRTMTRRVLEMALDQVAAWLAEGQHLTVAVNLSASSLVDADLPDQVIDLLTARGVPPLALQLEITEEFLMADRDRARSILTRLRDRGVRIAVDDFGTGYSSLSYLRELPIDELKLDRSFVFPMADDARAAALVASTIALAHSLGLRMVAEGVETEVTYTELARLGCDQAQGYFLSRPVPAAELEHWLRTRRRVELDPKIADARPAAAVGPGPPQY